MNFVFFKRACKLEGGGEPDGNPNQNNTVMKYQLLIYINKPLLYQYKNTWYTLPSYVEF